MTELRTVFNLEQLSDGYIDERIATLIRSLQFDHAQINVIENHVWEHTGRTTDTAIVLWHNPKWCMVFSKLSDPVSPTIRWLSVYNSNPESLLGFDS